MGCLFATGHVRLLVRDDFQSEGMETAATGAATAGAYASLATFQTDFHYGGEQQQLDVYDLRTGDAVTSLGGEALGCGGYSCETTMDELVINGLGFTAVHTTATADCGGTTNPCETIQASDSAGPGFAEALDSTETRADHSLRGTSSRFRLDR